MEIWCEETAITDDVIIETASTKRKMHWLNLFKEGYVSFVSLILYQVNRKANWIDWETMKRITFGLFLVLMLMHFGVIRATIDWGQKQVVSVILPGGQTPHCHVYSDCVIFCLRKFPNNNGFTRIRLYNFCGSAMWVKHTFRFEPRVLPLFEP